MEDLVLKRVFCIPETSEYYPEAIRLYSELVERSGLSKRVIKRWLRSYKESEEVFMSLLRLWHMATMNDEYANPPRSRGI